MDRLYGSRWAGVAIGVLATFAGLAAAELLAGLARGATSPVVAVGQEVIDVVPPAVKDWAIDWFGTADKAVLLIGTVAVLAVVGSIVGTLAVRGRLVAASATAALVGAVGVLAVVQRPAVTVGKVMPAVVGTIVSIGVVWWLVPRRPAVAGDPVADGDRVVVAGGDRRAFLERVGTVGVASVVVAAIGRSLGTRFDVGEERAVLDLPPARDRVAAPAGTEVGVDGVESWVVPNSRFYRIDTALVVPQVPRASWSLRIHGLVERELELTFEDLLEREQVERYITLSCVSNEVGGDLVGNALWQGVLLAPILREAGVLPEGTQVLSRSVDGWTCGTPTSAILDGRDAMLAIAMNGEPLPAEHGYPVRMVVPGLYGYVSATKWVTELELTRWEDVDAYWISRGWAKEAPVKTMARIDRPARGRDYERADDGAVDIAGLAWAVHRGISRVEVSIDEGEWLVCELAGVPTDDTWRQWRYRWTDATPGEHSVRARAVDGAGVVQPAEPRPPAPDGAQGYHRVEFGVS